MKQFLAAAAFGLLLTPGSAWAGDEGGSEAMATCAAGYELINQVCFPRAASDAGAENDDIVLMNPDVVTEATTSSASGLVVPLILLLLVAAAAAS